MKELSSEEYHDHFEVFEESAKVDVAKAEVEVAKKQLAAMRIEAEIERFKLFPLDANNKHLLPMMTSDLMNIQVSISESKLVLTQAKVQMAEAEEKKERLKSALQSAMDIRKFEIDLYWKRATYFWTSIGVIFAGYFLLVKEAEPNRPAIFTATCLGLVFAICWYLVNRGSKFWQNNWERHVDILEDKVHGSLYKIVLCGELRWRDFLHEYPYSVSKINQALSLFVVVIWSLLWLRSILSYCISSFGCEWLKEIAPVLRENILVGALTMLTIGFLIWVIRKSQSDSIADFAKNKHKDGKVIALAGLRKIDICKRNKI